MADLAISVGETVLGWINSIQVPLWIQLYLIMEFLFFVYVKAIVVFKLQKRRIPPKGRIDFADLAYECGATCHELGLNEKVSKYSIKRFIQAAFRGISYERVYRENFMEFASYAICNIDYWSMTEKDRETTNIAVNKFEEAAAYKFPPGRNEDPEVKPLRPNLDPIVFSHRMLIFYVFMKFVRLGGDIAVFLLGYRKNITDGDRVSYWIKHGTNLEAEPIIFFHGLTIGWPLYYDFIKNYFTVDQTVIMIEIPHLTMSLDFKVKSKEKYIKASKEICLKYKIKNATVIGHSFGTIYAGWIAHDLPKFVAQAIYIDPVCILLNTPEIPYRFFFRKPTSLFKYIIAFFFSLEITISYALRREFYWYESYLNFDLMNVPSTFVIAEYDGVIPSKSIKYYLEAAFPEKKAGKDIQVIFLENYAHAQVLKSTKALEGIRKAAFFQRTQHLNRNQSLESDRHFLKRQEQKDQALNNSKNSDNQVRDLKNSFKNGKNRNVCNSNSNYSSRISRSNSSDKKERLISNIFSDDSEKKAKATLDHGNYYYPLLDH